MMPQSPIRRVAKSTPVKRQPNMKTPAVKAEDVTATMAAQDDAQGPPTVEMTASVPVAPPVVVPVSDRRPVLPPDVSQRIDPRAAALAAASDELGELIGVVDQAAMAMFEQLGITPEMAAAASHMSTEAMQSRVVDSAFLTTEPATRTEWMSDGTVIHTNPDGSTVVDTSNVDDPTVPDGAEFVPAVSAAPAGVDRYITDRLDNLDARLNQLVEAVRTIGEQQQFVTDRVVEAKQMFDAMMTGGMPGPLGGLMGKMLGGFMGPKGKVING